MPQQLIYTSAPRGLVAGRSGHCTVARSTTMREALMLQLEKLSYYQHLSLSGGRERPIYSCRVVDLRGSRFHVLSRIQDAGLDFTGRTNFLAHHLVLSPEEVRQFPSPPLILRGWSGWVQSWSKEPQLLENEDWSELAGFPRTVSVPATTWQQLTGDSVNGYGLLELRAGITFRVDNLTEEQVLALFAESLELLELRDPRRDFRATAWQYTFTTSMQEQDNPADFRWRCLHSDNPASNRFAGPDCRPLSDVRSVRFSDEEATFARSGRQPPRFVVQPQNVRGIEGGGARLQAKAEGVPSPSYQWFTVDRAGNGQIIEKATDAELSLQNPPLGQSRYVVRASNSLGDVTSEVATLSIEHKLRLSRSNPASEPINAAKLTRPSYAKSAEDIERQRNQIRIEKERTLNQKRLRRNKFLVMALATVLIAIAGIVGWKTFDRKKSSLNPSHETGKRQDNESGTLAEQSPAADSATAPANTLNPLQNSTLVAETGTVQFDSNHKRDLPSGLPPPTEFGLPTGWTQMLIGAVSNRHAEFHPNVFFLTAAAEGFLANGDNVFFVCKTNFRSDFKATVPKVDASSTSSRCGIMLRNSLETNSPFLFIGASSEKIFAYLRDASGQLSSDSWALGKSNLLYLKIEYKGDRFTPTYSLNGSNWPAFTNFALSAAQQMWAGFAVCSGGLSNSVTAHFVDLLQNNVSIPKK
jgi:hypothetical protein